MNDNWRERISLFGAILISVLVVLAAVIITFMLFTFKVPQENKELAVVMFGAFNLGLGIVIQYWLGSSRSSAGKDQTIETMAKKGP